MITQHFILHMVPDTVRPRIYLSQRETGLEKLQFTMVGPNGTYYQIPENTSVTLVGTKPDKRVFSYACTYSGSTVTSDVTDQMTAVAGIVEAELRFEDSYGAMFASQNMEFIVERSPLEGTVCSINDFKSVDGEIISIHQDAVNTKRYAEQTESTYNTAMVEIPAAAATAQAAIDSTATSAISEVNTIKTQAESSITSTKDQAISAVEASSATTMAAFDEAVAYIQEYGTSGIELSYDNTTNSLSIIPLTHQ